MNEKIDEFGNKVEFTTTEVKDGLLEASRDLEDGFEAAAQSAKRKSGRAHLEEKAESGGKKIGQGARRILEFAGDSIGLLLLKNNGDRDLAYKIIKGGRDFGQTAEDLLGKAIKGGGKVAGAASEKVDVETLRQKAGEVVDTVKEKVKESDLLDKVNVEGMKTKVEDMFQNVTDKVAQGKEKFKSDPAMQEKKKADLEAKIEAFEKLYEEETIREELHPGDLYKPEEFKK